MTSSSSDGNSGAIATTGRLSSSSNELLRKVSSITKCCQIAIIINIHYQIKQERKQ